MQTYSKARFLLEVVKLCVVHKEVQCKASFRIQFFLILLFTMQLLVNKDKNTLMTKTLAIDACSRESLN